MSTQKLGRLFGLDPEGVNNSISQCWSEYWEANHLAMWFGEPVLHQPSKSNPQGEWVYPEKSWEVFQTWLQYEYFAGGKFAAYLQEKVQCHEITPEQAAWALTVARSPQMGKA